ncbi:MAG: alpha/beta hydrolase [Actinomycetota bacterium]|nr:alpha/beta hydrolase [Actinomycetota bacterium]
MPLIRRLWALWRLDAPLGVTWRVARWFTRYLARELAFQYAATLAGLIALVAITGVPAGAAGVVVVALLGVLLGWELRLAWAAWRSAAAVRDELSEIPGEPAASRFPRSHLWLPFLMLFARSVRRERAVVFHREPDRILRLDIYRPRRLANDEPRPAVIQVHGGGWLLGSRQEQGIPLLNHLAANGWVGFNVDYRLSPRATMPEHVIDVKRAIAWVRENAEDLGVDPGRICITGGSAGGHLAALAALTANDPSLQPGFEEADTTVVAAVPFYGVYDFTDPEGLYWPGFESWVLGRVVIKRRLAEAPELYRQSSPFHRIHAGAPPFMVFHGTDDSLIPVEDARAFARRLEAVSNETTLYVELPGAEHAFDLFPSLRTARVVEGIERFLRSVVDPPEEPADRVSEAPGSADRQTVRA